jgi:hypothetical protein
VRRKEGAFVVVQVAITAAVLLLVSLPAVSMQTTTVASRSSTSSLPATVTTPLWTYSASGQISSVSVSENGNYTVVAEQLNTRGGAILLFNRTGDLLWERQTDWVVKNAAISDNGSHILAIGYRYLYGPGRATSQENEVFALDSNGSVLWNSTSSSPYFGGTMSADGSRVAVFAEGSIASLTWRGQVLWNNSAAGADCGGGGPCPVFVSQDGSVVAADGGSGRYGITLLNSDGSVAWTYGESNQIWTNSVALTSSGYLIAAAQDVSIFNGTALLLSGEGVPLWEHHLDSGVDSAAVLQNGSTIGYVTDSNVLFYDRAGKLLANYSTDGESTLLPTLNGAFLGGGGNNLVLFDSAGKERWSSSLQTVLTAAVSGDGAFVAATTGARGEGAQGNSTLYFFSTT